MGIPDNQIILMDALESAFDPRNSFHGRIYATDNNYNDLYEGTDIDYSGSEVTAEAFMRLLTARYKDNTPLKKKLTSNSDSNILIYLSGHGGNEFFKFQDVDEISAQDLAHAIGEMYTQNRYNALLLVIDTCQASTMANYITSPRVIVIGSSSKGENSYGYFMNENLGVSVIDRFTFSFLSIFENHRMKKDMKGENELTISQLLSRMDNRFLMSTPQVWSSSLRRPLSTIAVQEFLVTDEITVGTINECFSSAIFDNDDDDFPASVYVFTARIGSSELNLEKREISTLMHVDEGSVITANLPSKASQFFDTSMTDNCSFIVVLLVIYIIMKFERWS